MSLMFFQKVSAAWRQAQEAWRSHPIRDTDLSPDWADEKATLNVPYGQQGPGQEQFDPEEYTRQILSLKEGETPRSAQWLMSEIKAGRALVDRGYVYYGRLDRHGNPTKECGPGMRRPYKIKPVRGHAAFMAEVERAGSSQRLREDLFGMGFDGINAGQFDPNQYTEYAPIMGGYFFAQQYLYDMLKGFAYAFEAWNHNPLAHRIVNALAQYTMGRRFTWNIQDERKERAWEEFAQGTNLVQRMSKFWVKEKLIFGEQMLDTKKWRTLHPATVWDVITDPDDFSDVYYYFRSYPTAYQMFTGRTAAGVPGAKDVPAQRYVVEQVPFSQIIHTKSNCTSFEKRGRSTLFPILGWLKRIKDIYNNQAVREQMLADYVWDVEIDGGPGDVSKYAAQYQRLAMPGSTHFHNKAVKRTPMAAAQGATSGGHSETSNNVLAFIATAIGLPKDFFNVIAQSGGNRATALVAAEPFTKVIEDEQADQEFMLHQVAKEVFERAGLDYHYEDIEFTFPSVTKDTTSETVKNISIGETLGYISKERAATLFTQEMNITAYDFDQEQKDIANEKAKGISNQGMPGMPDGRMGGDDQNPGAVGDSPIRGEGKGDVQDSLGTL